MKNLKSSSWRIKISMHFLPSKSIQAESINAQYSVIDNSIMNMIRNGIEKGVVMNINNQSFGTVNGSVNNIENGNSYNTTNINSADKDEIMDLMKSFKELILSESEITAEDKDELVDDIELLSEQIASSETNKSRVKSIIKRLGRFIENLPGKMTLAENILDHGNSLVKKIVEYFNL